MSRYATITKSGINEPNEWTKKRANRSQNSKITQHLSEQKREKKICKYRMEKIRSYELCERRDSRKNTHHKWIAPAEPERPEWETFSNKSECDIESDVERQQDSKIPNAECCTTCRPHQTRFQSSLFILNGCLWVRRHSFIVDNILLLLLLRLLLLPGFPFIRKFKFLVVIIQIRGIQLHCIHNIYVFL